MRRRCPCWSRPCGHAATRTATSRRSWERTSSACSVPFGDSFLGAPHAVADAALERVGGALDQEVPGRRRQNVVAVQREPSLLDVDPPHPPEERLARRRVGLVLHLGQLRQPLAARARHLRVQELHHRESGAAERLDPLLRREGEYAHQDAAHVFERHVARLYGAVRLDHGGVPGRQEERLLVPEVQRRPIPRHQPVPAERRLEGVALVVRLEDKETALPAPVPLVLPVAGAVFVGRTAPGRCRSRGFGWLAPRRDDGIAFFFGNRRRGLFVRATATATAADEVPETGGAPNTRKNPGGASALLRGVSTPPATHPPA